MMARARTASLQATVPTQTEALLQQIEADRNKLAGELEVIQRLPRGDGSDIVQRGEGLKGMLEAVGLQLEQVLGAVFRQEKSRS